MWPRTTAFSLLLAVCLGLGRVLAQSPDGFTISFVGDIYPAIFESQPAWALERLAQVTADSDAVFGNLECAMTDSTQATPHKSEANLKNRRDYLLKCSPTLNRQLAAIGVRVVSLANNHALDYQARGLEDTLRSLDEVGILACGAGPNLARARAPVFLDLGGARVGFVAYSEICPLGSKATATSPGLAPILYPPSRADRDRILGSVKQARAAGADIVVVSLHWGKENYAQVEPYQRGFARSLIDGGADCVIGHHPHVVREVENYRGKTIAYSLGNYAFNYGTRSTIRVRIRFHRDDYGPWLQDSQVLALKLRRGLPQP